VGGSIDIALPSTVGFSKNGSAITCLSGCSSNTNSFIAYSTTTNVLTVVGVAGTEIPANSVINFQITGFTNPSDYSAAYFNISSVDNAGYLIESTGALYVQTVGVLKVKFAGVSSLVKQFPVVGYFKYVFESENPIISSNSLLITMPKGYDLSVGT